MCDWAGQAGLCAQRPVLSMGHQLQGGDSRGQRRDHCIPLASHPPAKPSFCRTLWISLYPLRVVVPERPLQVHLVQGEKSRDDPSSPPRDCPASPFGRPAVARGPGALVSMGLA